MNIRQLKVNCWLLALLSQTGCVYLHNDGPAKQAESVLSQYRGFQTNSGGVFGVMLENHAKVQQAFAERQAAAAELKFKAYASSVPNMTWNDLMADVTNSLATNALTAVRLSNDFAVAVQTQLQASNELKTADAALTELTKQRKAAETERDQWQARYELFQGLLEFYTGQTNDLAKLDKTALEQLKKQALERKVTGTTNTVGELLSDDLKQLEKVRLGGLATSYTVDLLDPKKAPGIKVQMLSLGEDLAQARKDRVQLDLNRFDALERAWNDEQAALKFQNEHLRKARDGITSRTSARDGKLATVSAADTITASLETIRQGTNAVAEREATLQSCSRILIYYLMAVTEDESTIREIETKPSAIGHEYAIRLAQVNAGEREAFILRGLESLNRYHQGGITSEEIANLLRAAQAAGIGVIGGAQVAK